MRIGPEPVANYVKDYLAELESSPLSNKARVANHRLRKRLTKLFTTCIRCSKPLFKYGTWWGTDVENKAVCKTCKDIKQSPSGCLHLRLRSFTFSDGRTIKMCPDCTDFDSKRYTTLNSWKPFGEHSKRVVVYKQNDEGRPYHKPLKRVKDRYGSLGQLLDPIVTPSKSGGSHPYEDHNQEPFDAAKWQVVPLSVTKVNMNTPTRKELRVAYELRQIEEMMREPAKKVSISNILHSRSSTPSRVDARVGPRLPNGFFNQWLDRWEKDHSCPVYQNDGNHREVVTGGKAPRIVAGNYGHRLEDGWMNS